LCNEDVGIEAQNGGILDFIPDDYLGNSIGVSGTLAFFIVGGTFDIGIIWDGDDNWSPYIALGSAYGFDASVGVEYKQQMKTDKTRFEIGDYNGFGSSDNYGVSIVDFIYGGNIDPFKSPLFEYGATYEEAGGGISYGSPLGYTRQFTYTLVLSKLFK